MDLVSRSTPHNRTSLLTPRTLGYCVMKDISRWKMSGGPVRPADVCWRCVWTQTLSSVYNHRFIPNAQAATTVIVLWLEAQWGQKAESFQQCFSDLFSPISTALDLYTKWDWIWLKLHMRLQGKIQLISLNLLLWHAALYINYSPLSTEPWQRALD